jgi:GMP synthase (glutamine-hydrolysing)
MNRVKPFLLLATRAEDEAADNEYDAFLAAAGLKAAQLRRIRLEAAPLPALDLDDYSGIMVGGSPFTASDPDEHKSEPQRRVERELGALLDEVVARDLPFLGACYGIGLLGTHQHGLVDRRWSEAIGRIRVSLTEDGARDPVFSALPESFDAFVGHKEACSELPPGAVLLATGEDCPVQAFRIRRNIYATQFHPELTVDGIVTRIHVYRNYGYFQPDQMQSLIASVEGVSVPEPGKVLAAFVRRYARP